MPNKYTHKPASAGCNAAGKPVTRQVVSPENLLIFLVIMICIIIWNTAGVWYCRQAIWSMLASNSDKIPGF